jgi:hypothetical protein
MKPKIEELPGFVNWEDQSSNCFERVRTFVPSPPTVDHKLSLNCLFKIGDIDMICFQMSGSLTLRGCQAPTLSQI